MQVDMQQTASSPTVGSKPDALHIFKRIQTHLPIFLFARSNPPAQAEQNSDLQAQGIVAKQG
jgi:hypothetical protein